MSWRTVVITRRCKLDYSMGYLVVRDDDTKKIFLDELSVLVLENTAVSLTGCLLEALTEKKVKVIFCDSRHNPMAELVPHHGSFDSSQKIRTQISWGEDIKAAVWREIVIEKIRRQAELLEECEKERECALLRSYIPEVEPLDATNREGHAAKVYFNALFGMDFTRSEEQPINAALNYGYSILLSAFNREIAANGYLTQLGIFHCNMFNHFNLSCDLMEPFRIRVDRIVHTMSPSVFGSDEKHSLWNLLNEEVYIDYSRQTLLNAVRIYTRSVFEALNDSDTGKIKFPTRNN